MKTRPSFLLVFAFAVFVLACQNDASSGKGDPGNTTQNDPCKIVIDKIDTTGAASRMHTLSIIVDDILDTAYVGRTDKRSAATSTTPESYFFIGPTNRVVQGYSSLVAQGTATPSGADWTVGRRTLTTGAGGDFIPVHMTIQGRDYTLLMSRAALADAYLQVQ